ncbi:MAG: ECF transporter S component [Defluviitaleaceae bacterium]|nr:ECF transporter S component [Defluviitaleaceae bacterium]
MGRDSGLVATRKMVAMAMISAIAFLLAAFVRFPVVPAVGFLRYDPKDVIIVIGGYLFGPLAALIVTVVVAMLEMFTVSGTGFVGFIMNVVSGVAFACTASAIYSRWRTRQGAIIGLIAATLAMTAVMMLWNYFLTPIFLDQPREQVARLLVPGFMPFNLFSGTLNSAIILLIYKPISRAISFSGLMATSQPESRRLGAIIPIAAALIAISGIMWILVQQGLFDPRVEYYEEVSYEIRRFCTMG